MFVAELDLLNESQLRAGTFAALSNSSRETKDRQA